VLFGVGEKHRVALICSAHHHDELSVVGVSEIPDNATGEVRELFFLAVPDYREGPEI